MADNNSSIGAAPVTRRYCWRSGTVEEFWPGDKCPECGSPGHKHEAVPDDVCSRFAPCGDHGHPCQLPTGHDGRCPGTTTCPNNDAPAREIGGTVSRTRVRE